MPGLVAVAADTIKPRGDRVLIRVEIAPEKVGMIVIPDKVRLPGTTGIILEVGPKVEDFKPGQRVMIASYSGNFIEGHRDLVIMREEDILAEIRDS